tara:strand:+ start:149 stop:1291 length:1143 start_codon:yes stop_codon:yes gene_type:complete
MIEKRKYQICKTTVMDTSDSNITFDKYGISDHANNYKTNLLPKLGSIKYRNEELEKNIIKIKKEGANKEYDCLLGLSGGLDSSYMLHLAIKEFGLRPLVFHTDSGWNTDTAVNNINNLVESLKLDLFTDVVNWEQMQDFQLAFFKSGLPHIDIPQDHAFTAALYKYAKKFRIKTILNGFNLATEGIRNPLEFFYYGTDLKHLKFIIKEFGTKKLDKLNFSSIYYQKIYLRYLKGVKIFKPLNYINFNKKNAISILKREYNWKEYSQKHFESRFTRFYEGYWLPERFGFDTRRVVYSSLILANQMDREEALNMLKEKALDDTTIKNEFEFVSRKLDISTDELNHYLNLPKKFYWDYPNQYKIIKLGAKFLNKFGSELTLKR